MKILLLLLLISCGGGGSSGGSSGSLPNTPLIPVIPADPTLDPETILLNYDNNFKYTKLSTASFNIQSDKEFSLAKIYKGSNCSDDTFVRNVTRSELLSGVVVNLLGNQNNQFNIDVYDQNNLKSINCLNIANIVNDTVSPTTLGMSTYLTSKIKNVSSLEFLVGGDINYDHPESNLIDKVVYYKLVESIQVKVGEYPISEYNEKNIRLILSENEANLFYFSVIDLAGNESDKAGILIVDHQNTNPSAPLLTQELINIKNRYTDQTVIALKGIVGISTQRVRIYSDSSKSTLIADELASVFENTGISVSLTLNSYNDYYIVAVKNSTESVGVSFGINQKTTPPNKPVVNPYIMQAHNTIQDDGIEKYIALNGTADVDVVKINIYSDAARTDLLISYNIDDWLASSGPLYMFSEGLNTLYFVSEDDVGRESVDSVYLNVTFDTEE